MAEGVETEEQIEVLRTLGCDGIQGYFCKPISAEKFLNNLITGRLPQLP
jgi:EAL domain-containing protein (putative c-di-GMP-specific phosphodiesterase class I)